MAYAFNDDKSKYDLTENFGKAYEIPMTRGMTGYGNSIVSNSFLTVWPALKIMRLYIDLQNNASGDITDMFSASPLFKDLPVVVNGSSSTWRTRNTFGLYKYAAATSDFLGAPEILAEVLNVNDSNQGTPPFTGSKVGARGPFKAGERVYGQIILPYSSLNALHPLSSGTLIDPTQSA